MSLRSPDLMVPAETPILSSRPSALTVTMMTPIEPVTVVGCAMIVSAAFGYIAAHINTCMPPSEPPAMACRCSMPRCWMTSFCDSTMSSIVGQG